MATILTPTSGSTTLDINGNRVIQQPIQLRDDSMYLVDFTKLKSVNDLITIIAAMGVSFHKSHPHIDMVKPFLATDNPIPMMPQSAPMPELDENEK
jgi:hypothetical protein